MNMVYIASKFKFKDKVVEVYKELMKNDFLPTVIWWEYEGKLNLKDLPDEAFYNNPKIKYLKKRDLFCIDECDIFVLVSDNDKEYSFNGANFELGYATAKGKKTFVIGKLDKSALYSGYSGVCFCKDLKDFIAKINCLKLENDNLIR